MFNRVYQADFCTPIMDRITKFSSNDDEVNLEYLFNIGLSHAKRGKPRDAIFYFDKVLSVEPYHVNALINKGNALGKLGKYEVAITIYDTALKIKPDHSVCLLNKGLACHYLKKYEEAISCYNTILSQNPENANALYHKACTKSLQRNIDGALELLEQAIRIDSEFATKASRDKDFESIRSDTRFKALTA